MYLFFGTRAQHPIAAWNARIDMVTANAVYLRLSGKSHDEAQSEKRLFELLLPPTTIPNLFGFESSTIKNNG